MENLSRMFWKHERKKNIQRLSFITKFKIESLLPFTGRRKVPGKMAAMVLQNTYLGHKKQVKFFLFFATLFSLVTPTSATAWIWL